MRGEPSIKVIRPADVALYEHPGGMRHFRKAHRRPSIDTIRTVRLKSWVPLLSSLEGSFSWPTPPIPPYQLLDIGTRNEAPRIRAMRPLAIQAILLFRRGVRPRGSTYSSSS